VTFTYDGEGHRTRIQTTSAAGATSTTDFRYQGDAIVEEIVTDSGHPSGAVVRRYAVDDAGSTVKLTIPAGEPYAGDYLVNWNGHGDALNLLRVNADGTTTLANSFSYTSWGAPTTTTHNGIGDLGFRFLYVGQHDVQWDNAFGLGLLYMHARHYGPTLGRFLQPDPVAAEENHFTYVSGNPITRSDPSGTYSPVDDSRPPGSMFGFRWPWQSAPYSKPYFRPARSGCTWGCSLPRSYSGRVSVPTYRPVRTPIRTAWVVGTSFGAFVLLQTTIRSALDSRIGMNLAGPVDRRVLQREIERAGWTLKPGSGRGPHDIYVKPGHPPVSLPRHRQVSPGVARQIRQILRGSK
jgi:RHS repeat-associated protein